MFAKESVLVFRDFGKKRGEGKGGRDDPDDEYRDALVDPLALLKGSAKKCVVKGGFDPNDEDRPRKPLLTKEKCRLEEEQRRREMEAARRSSRTSAGVVL